MYIKTTKQKNKDGTHRTYLQITESYREGSKVKQRVLFNLGRLDQLQKKGQIDKLIEKLVEFSELHKLEEKRPELFNEKVIYHGAITIFNKLWRELGLKHIITSLLQTDNDTIDYITAIEQMVLSRLIDPMSKRALGFDSQKLTLPNKEAFEVHQYYRAMDKLYPCIEKVEDMLFDKRPYDLFDQKLDVIFFDTISVKYYGECPKSLMKHGHSKVKRRDLFQMVVGLLVDTSGIPIAHKIFPGNIVDVKTLIPVVKEFKERFRIDKVIITGDGGMMSESNLLELENLDWKYIIAGRPKNEKYIKEEVFTSREPYTFVEETLLLKEVLNEEKQRRYILCYNPIEGWDEYERRKQVLDKLLEYEGHDTKRLVSNRGYRSFIKSGLSKIMVDMQKAKEEVKYDGRYVIKTNCDLPKEEVAYYYKALIRVEQCFHELKGVELLAPIFHWSEKRVRTHVFICVLALIVLQSYVEKLRSYAPDLHERDCWREVTNMMSNIVSANGKKYLLRMEASDTVVNVFKAIGTALPQRQHEV